MCALSQNGNVPGDRSSASTYRSSEAPAPRCPTRYYARMKTRFARRRQTGFTLYELLLTVFIVGVVLSFGLANMSDFTRNGRMAATINDLHGAFHLARSEAARAKTNITICASATAMSAAPDCGGNWSQGYIVFTDLDGDLTVDPGAPGDVVLRRHGPVADGINLTFANNASFFGFAASGQGRGTVGGNAPVSQVLMCDERGNVPGGSGWSTARAFVVTPLGRGAILKDEAQIQNVITAMGASCP